MPSWRTARPAGAWSCWSGSSSCSSRCPSSCRSDPCWGLDDTGRLPRCRSPGDVSLGADAGGASRGADGGGAGGSAPWRPVPAAPRGPRDQPAHGAAGVDHHRAHRAVHHRVARTRAGGSMTPVGCRGVAALVTCLLELTLAARVGAQTAEELEALPPGDLFRPLLADRATSRRMELLEWIIIVLIALSIIVSLGPVLGAR